MDTGVVITQEPVFTKTSVEEAHAVVLEHSTTDVDKVNLSTVLDDGRTSTIQGKPEVAEVLNGPGNKETEESKQEKKEVMKTISVVEDSKIVEEKEKDEQGTVFVHQPKNTDDAKIILTDVTLEKEKEDETTQNPEEVSVETETKNSQEQEKDISKATEEIPIKTDEVEEEKDSRTVETSVNGIEADHNETVSVEEFTRNGDNIVKETAPEQDVETTERVLVEAEKDETETINNEETTVHDLKENADAVETIKNSDDAEKVSSEVTGDKEKEEDIIHKEAEVQESPNVIGTATIQGEDTEPKASRETEEHGHVLVRDIPQDESLVPMAETVDTSTVQESVILKTLETKCDETDAEPSLDLKEEEETVTPSDEVLAEPPKPSPDQRSIDTEEDENVLGSKMPQGEVESQVTSEDREQEDKEQEKTDKFEFPKDLALKIDREVLMGETKEADQVAGAQSLETGPALNELEAEETPVIKHMDVESEEKMEKPFLESPSKLSEETRKTLDEKIQGKPEEEEEVAANQEGQEEGSYGSETVPVPESIELKEKAQEDRILDLPPLQEESCLPVEKDEGLKSDEVIQVSSASPEGDTLVEAKKIEEIKANEEEEQVAADKIQSILEIVDTEPVNSNEETTVHESISLKDDSDAVEEIKNSDDASHEETRDREKEEEIIIHKSQEAQESLTVAEMPTVQGEDIELKASKDTEEHEHVLVRDMPQEETLVPKAETVNTSTVHESPEPSRDLKEQEETVKTVTSADEVQESITLMEPPKLSPEQISKDTEEDEHVLERSMPQGEIFVTEAESLVTKENKEAVMDLKEQEKTEKLEELPSDLALKVDKKEVMDEKKEADEVAGDQNMERGLELNEPEAELVDQNITEETQEKLVEKPSLESPSEVSEETDNKIQEKPEVEVTKEEGVSVPESSEVEEKSIDLNPFQEESCLPLEKDEEEKQEQIHKHEQENEEVKSDEVTQVSSGSPEGETVVEAKKKEEIKANEEEQVLAAAKIQSILETVETVDTEPVKSNEDDTAESLDSAGEEIQTKSKNGENLQINETAETSLNVTEDEHNATVLEEGISNKNESIVLEIASEEIKYSDEAEENSPEVTKDREKEEDIITRETTDEMHESQNLLLQEENSPMEHENLLVRDVPQIDTLVTEAEDVNTSTVHKFESNEEEAGQETRKDIEPSFDLKEETETVISSDETEESVEVKSKETIQGERTEEKHENLIDVPSGDSEKLQAEAVLVAKTESQDKTEHIPSELVLKEEPKDDKREVDGTQVMGELHEPEAEQIDQTKTDEKVLVESVEKMQTSSLECPSESSEEKITTVDDKMEEKLQEEVTLQQEGSSSAYGLEIKEEETFPVPESKDHGEEVSSLPKETTLHQEHLEVYEPTNDQQSLVEEKSDGVMDVSSASPSEEHEGGIVVNDVKVEDIIANEEEQVLEEIQRSLEAMEPEEHEQETVSKKIEDEKVEEEPIVQISSEEDAIKIQVTEADNGGLSEEAKKRDEETEVRETQQGETSVNEAESVDTSAVQEATVLKTLETEINESEAVHSPIDGEEEEERQVAKEDTEARLDLKEEKEQEETEAVISSDEHVIIDENQEREESAEIKHKENDANLLDVPSEKMQRPSLESPSELLEETSKTVDEKIEEKQEEEEVTLHQESQETVIVPESSELGVQAKEEKEESCPPNEQENETKEQTSEEDSTSAHQTPVEEKSDQASSAPVSEEREAQEIEDLKENEEEQVAEAVETVEPHSSFPSPPEESDTVEEAEKVEEEKEEKVKETEPMGDVGTGSSILVEEEKLKQDKEISEVDESKAEETLSDVTAVQLKREVNATITESHEEEATVAQTRDIETSLTDKFSIDEEEEQANEESLRNEQEKVIIPTEKGETRELEEENMVDSSEKNDNETLVAETKKENEDKTVGLLDASKTSENKCTKQEEFENLETPKVEDKKSQEVCLEAKGDQSPSFITELEDKIPKQIKEIHEEETKESQAVVDQTPSLVSEQVEVEEEEETKEPHKVEALNVQDLPVEASHAHPSELVSELDDEAAKEVEEIHQEETKAHKLQEEEEILPTETVPSESFSEKQEERHVSAATEESVGETKPKESDDQIETSTEVTEVEDEEDTKETDTQVAEIMEGQSLPHAPKDACLEQEELKDLGTLQPGAVMEDQDSVVNQNSSDDITFSKSIGEAEHGDENSSTLPVVGILKELQTTLEENERGNDLNSIYAEPETLEKSLVVGATPASEIIEASMLQDSISRELEVNVEETLQVETREIAECKEEIPADSSLTEVLPGEKILIPSNQEEGKEQEDANASTSEKISLQEEEHSRDCEISKEEHNAEAQETVEEEIQTFDIKEEKKNEELQDEKLGTLLYATRETDETSSPEVNNNDQEDASELGGGHDSATTPQVGKEQEAHSVLGNDQEVNVVLTSERKTTEPLSVAEKELTEEHVKSQAVSDKNEETVDALITSEKVQLQDQSKGFGQEKQSIDLKYVQEDLDDEIKDDGHDLVLAHKKDSDIIEEKEEVGYVKTEPEDAIKHGVSTQEKNIGEKTGLEATKEINQEECKQEDTATAIKEEIKEEEKKTTEDSLNITKNTEDEIKDYGLDSVVAQMKESGSVEEKEVEYVKTELKDAVKHGVSTEEEATKEIYEEEECKQTNTVTTIKEEMKEEKEDTPVDFLNSMKNTDDVTEKSKPKIQEIDKLSPVSETPPKQADEVPTQQKREIADDVPKIENLKIAEEVQQKDREDKTETIVKEPARKSLSDLIQNVKVTDNTEVATTEPCIEEEAKAEGEDEDGDEHKDDKTSPDSIVMVEAKDTVSIIKTQKKSHGILSGVGSKVKHSISKVKKALTGKSSHPTKPSSPQ
ncbi:A-kinase anchor-like protein [Hirschfeldia incana]|nr:A-kinase anchor-like protein [Hirschfeldia incana]